MNVLYIDHYAGSETLGMEFRPFYLAHEWRRAGIDTTILAADYSHLRSHNPDIGEDLEEKVIDGVRFCFLRTRHYHGNNFDRILSMAQFVQKGMKAADELIRRYQPDVVICSSTYPMDTWIGQKIKRKSGAMLIHEIHDLWPLSPRLLGGYSKHHPFIAAMQVAAQRWVPNPIRGFHDLDAMPEIAAAPCTVATMIGSAIILASLPHCR